MRKELVVPLTLAALVLGAIFVIAPRVTVATEEPSIDLHGIDNVGLTLNAKDLLSNASLRSNHPV
jgi:hypothetical protein